VRTGTSSSLGHQGSFLEQDAQSSGRVKNHFLSPTGMYLLQEVPPSSHKNSNTHYTGLITVYKLFVKTGNRGFSAYFVRQEERSDP